MEMKCMVLQTQLKLINEGENININFKGSLREKQKPVVKKYLKHVENNGGGCLALHTGFGKTCLALYIIAALKKKTIIIVHKEFLMRQWIERIEQFLPDAKVGKIQAKTKHKIRSVLSRVWY